MTISKTIFRCRGYSIDATPTALADGKFRAVAQLTKIGFNPEISFSALPVFSSEAEAVAYAKQFSEEWLSRKA